MPLLSKAKVVYCSMLLSMPSYIVAVNVASTLVPIGLHAHQIVSDLTIVLLPQGSLTSVLFGKLLVCHDTFTTSYIPQGKLEL